MSEWTSVLAVFWALWAADGVRLAPRPGFTVVGGCRARGVRASFSRLSVPGLLPHTWRMTTTDVPLALSPEGLCNRPVGSAGRPAEAPAVAQAWRWSEVREVGVARGWIYVNGLRFCPDTRHVSAPELLALTGLTPPVRAVRIDALMRRWLRPAHLRRRARVLEARTAIVARANALSLVALLALSVYVVGDLAPRLPHGASAGLAAALPALLTGLLALHLTAVVLTRRAVRRLKAVTTDTRGTTLLSAWFMPPQALRLRAAAGEGFFPVQHPLAAALAWGAPAEVRRMAFRVMSDLRWPIGEAADAPLAREIAGWFRGALAERIAPLLQAASLSVETLLAAPRRNAPGSCSYCPRCQDQFVAGRTECPHGVTLRPLPRSDSGR